MRGKYEQPIKWKARKTCTRSSIQLLQKYALVGCYDLSSWLLMLGYFIRDVGFSEKIY